MPAPTPVPVQPGRSTLCVLFNHPYPKNIPVLRELYRGRFSNVIFVQMLAQSEDPDVFTSYRGSYSLHGMVTDVFDELMSHGSEHYFFTPDDVLLNPLWDDAALVERLSLGDGRAFAQPIWPIVGPMFNWIWSVRTVWKLLCSTNPIAGSGMEAIMVHLPDPDALKAKIQALYHFDFSPLTYDPDAPLPPAFLTGDKAADEAIMHGLGKGLLPGGQADLPFPLVGGGCDFFAVHRSVMSTLRDRLGIYAAAELFAEVAVPTALIDAADFVTQPGHVGLEMDWRWHAERLGIDPEQLAAAFRDNLLAMHPVKLSQGRAEIVQILRLLNSPSADAVEAAP